MALVSPRGYKTRTAQRLAEELQDQLRETGREAARRVVEYMRQDAPELHGFLRKSITFRTFSRPNGNFEVRFYANPTNAGAVRDYAEAVERGTGGHARKIHPTRSKALAIWGDLSKIGVVPRSEVFYRKKVSGQDAQPFFHRNVERFDDIYQGLRRRRGLTGR